MSNTQNEEWKPVVGFEQAYEVSSAGRVRSIDRIVTSGQKRRGKLLRTSFLGKTYPLARLAWGGKYKTVLVHQLVAEAFIGPRPPGLQIRHLNGDARNSRVENLCYGTAEENAADKIAHGTAMRFRVARGEHNMASKERCPRGHVLAEPNLVRSAARRGFRDCLACCRARAAIRKEGHGDLQVISDEYYSAIAVPGVSADPVASGGGFSWGSMSSRI